MFPRPRPYPEDAPEEFPMDVQAGRERMLTYLMLVLCS
jgi:hypothetical protein